MFHSMMGRIRQATEMEESRRSAAIAQASNRLKGDFYKQYRVQLVEDRSDRGHGTSRLIASSSSDRPVAPVVQPAAGSAATSRRHLFPGSSS